MLRLRVIFLCFAAGCTTAAPQPAVAPNPAPVVSVIPPADRGLVAQPPLGVYALDEVLADILSSPIEYIGTGPWKNIQKRHACAYHNDRVLIVDVYCTVTETKAMRVDVFSPTRGHARLYAEAGQAISRLDRRDYFTFIGEVHPAPLRRSRLPPLSLSMSFPQIQSYANQHYESFLPSCYGGEEVHRPQGGCLRELAPLASAWRQRNESFLERPPAQWYQVVGQLRALAVQYGRDLN